MCYTFTKYSIRTVKFYDKRRLSWIMLCALFFIAFGSCPVKCSETENNQTETVLRESEDFTEFSPKSVSIATTEEPIKSPQVIEQEKSEEKFTTVPSFLEGALPEVQSTIGAKEEGQENEEVVAIKEVEHKNVEEDFQERMGHVRKRAIRSLIQIFGLPDDSLLKATDKFGPAPEFMIDLYNTITDAHGVTRAKNPYGAHVIRSFMEKDNKKYDFFYFNLTVNGKLKETEKVVEAELHLYRNPIPHDRLHPSLYLTPFYILSLYQVVDSRNLAIPDLHKLLGVHYVPALGSGWQVFNVTQTVMEWLKGEKQNLGFIVAATSLGGDRVPVTFSRRHDTSSSDKEKSDKQPILVLFNHDDEVEKMNRLMMNANQVSDSFRRSKKGKGMRSKNEDDDENHENNSAPVLPNIPNSSLENPRFHHSLLYQDSIRHPNSVSRFRSRRSKNQTEPDSTSNSTTDSTSSTNSQPDSRNLTSCEKHDLFISFETIGWSSWIISPKGYNAYYCSGPCVFPLGHEVTPTNHATLQSIAHELALSQDVGRPCCVPTKLLPISLLYYDDDDNVVLKQYVDMVADTCGCH